MRRAATRAGNRLNRDNSGRISGIGRNGATVRGGRLKTAKGNARATRLASMKPAGFRGGTIAKGGRGVRGMVARSLAAVRKERMAGAKPVAAIKPAAKASAKPAKKESKRNISDAKAGRIIARLDANRPGLRKATGSDRRNRNLLQTYDRASRFVLAASTRESKRSGGQSRMDLAESVRRAVRNAKAKAKPKPPKPVNNKPKRSLAVRVAKADKADRKLAAQLKQAKASENLKKENELIRRRQRIDRFNKTYNLADLKASKKVLTPAKPTAPKRTRASRPAGTVAKPRGMKPGVLERRGKTISRNNNASPQKVNQESVRSLLAAGQSVFVYPRKGTVVVNGFKYYKVSKAMAATLNKIVKDHRSSR
jgi:hypothetical protein